VRGPQPTGARTLRPPKARGFSRFLHAERPALIYVKRIVGLAVGIERASINGRGHGAIQENASKQQARASIPIQSERERHK
jgi:hypothetical protein